MDLALGRASADCAEAHQIGVVLAKRGIEKFAGSGQPQFSYIEQDLSGLAQALVDMEAAVQIRITD